MSPDPNLLAKQRISHVSLTSEPARHFFTFHTAWRERARTQTQTHARTGKHKKQDARSPCVHPGVSSQYYERARAGLELYHRHTHTYTHTCRHTNTPPFSMSVDCTFSLQLFNLCVVRGTHSVFVLSTTISVPCPAAGVRGTTQVEVTRRGVIMLWAGHNKTEGNPLKANH